MERSKRDALQKEMREVLNEWDQSPKPLKLILRYRYPKNRIQITYQTKEETRVELPKEQLPVTAIKPELVHRWKVRFRKQNRKRVFFVKMRCFENGGLVGGISYLDLK